MSRPQFSHDPELNNDSHAINNRMSKVIFFIHRVQKCLWFSQVQDSIVSKTILIIEKGLNFSELKSVAPGLIIIYLYFLDRRTYLSLTLYVTIYRDISSSSYQL